MKQRARYYVELETVIISKKKNLTIYSYQAPLGIQNLIFRKVQHEYKERF